MSAARQEAIRLALAHTAAAACLLEALQHDEVTEGDDLPPEEPVSAACPFCKEAREEKLEDTPHPGEDGVLVPRKTCLSCGRSFSPEVSRG